MSLHNSLRVRGVGGTIQLAYRRVFNFGKTPPHILSRMLDLEKFDREHGVETAGLIELDRLRIDSPVKIHGTRYGGMAPWRMRELLSRIPGSLCGHTFIDIGSGKGAVLFQASAFPFRKIIGVEFSPELHAAALRNIHNFHSRTRKCHDIAAICGDGGAFEYPEGPWVLFFNSPFDVPVWRRAAENLARAKRGAGNSYLIYSNVGWLPEAAAFVHSLDFLKLVHEDDTSRIYEFVG